MSGTGPDSMPTSADPRSKRPLKKRALSPVSAQATQLEALFARPDQEIRIPPSAAAAQGRRRLPPEIVTNVQGSSAGAGSGEFHVYKVARRREYERLRLMDEEMRREAAAREFEDKRTEADRRDDEKTRRNREKREKMKARKEKAAAAAAAAAGQKNGPGAGNTAGAGGIKQRQDGVSHHGHGHGQDGIPENDASKADASGRDSSGAGTTSASGLVINDDD